MSDIDDFHQPKNQAETGSDEKKHHAEGKTVERLNDPESHSSSPTS
jgi:hypothetical protein